MESFFFISLGITFLLIIMLVYHFKQRIIALEHKHDTMFEIVNNIVKQLRNMQTNIQHLGEPKPFIISPPTYIPHQPVFESIQMELADDESDDETETSESSTDDESDDETETSESEEDEPVEITSFDEIPKENIHVQKGEEPSVQEDDIIIRKSDGSVSGLIESISGLAESISALDENTKPIDSKDNYKKMTLAALKTAVVEKGLATDASKMKKPELLKLLEADNE